MKNINKDEAINKELIINDDSRKYNEIEKNYKYLFEYFLSKKIDLTKYDKLISNSGLYFGTTNKYKELNSYLKLDYIYLLNNFYIEKLTKEEIKELSNIDKTNLDKYLNLIESTYKEIIKDNYFNNEYTDKVYNICYGINIPSNFALNNNLVLKIYYGLNPQELDDKYYIANSEEKEKFLVNLKQDIIKEVKDILNIDCTILDEKIFDK